MSAGYFVTLESVQPWMEWAIHISPFFYAIQEITVAIFGHGVPGGEQVLDFYGFESHSGLAFGVLCSVALFFRCMQALALKHLNKIER